eukprot:9217489-Prorocentrum_lima.AAC.1
MGSANNRGGGGVAIAVRLTKTRWLQESRSWSSRSAHCICKFDSSTVGVIALHHASASSWGLQPR